jgi:hypothetical protein
VLRNCEALIRLTESYPDGEAVYTVTRMLARAGWRDLALKGLSMAIGLGFFPAPLFDRDPWLDDLREVPEYQQLVARARERFLAVDAAFQAAGGYRLLGLDASSRIGAAS